MLSFTVTDVSCNHRIIELHHDKHNTYWNKNHNRNHINNPGSLQEELELQFDYDYDFLTIWFWWVMLSKRYHHKD
jgi:hypothetical protein